MRYPRYELSVRILPDSRRLEASGIIALPASDTAREAVELSLSELMRDLRFEVLSPAASAGPAELAKVSRPSSRVGWGTDTWRVKPAHPFAAGEPVRLRFSYSGGGTSNIFSIEPDCAFAGGISTAWYPEVESVPVRPDGRLRGTQGVGLVEYTVPAGFVVHAQGVPQSTPEEHGRGVFRFDVRDRMYFAFGAARYTVSRRPGRIPLTAYLLRNRDSTQAFLAGAAKILDLLGDHFGPYPFSEFALVEVPTDQADRAGFAGASMDGFMFPSSEFLDKPFNTAYYGHEIGHQWWGGLIKPGTSDGAWMLTEGMAEYAGLYIVGKLDGESAAERYRRRGYPGYYNLGGVGYLRLAAAGLDRPLATLPPDPSIARPIVNSKGNFAWSMLADELGLESFKRVLRGFIKQHAYERIPWNIALQEIERKAGRDLTWFYTQWFDGTGAPAWRLAWRLDGRVVRGTILQDPPHFRTRVEVRLEGPGCTPALQTIEVRGARTEFHFTAACRVEAVLLDPAYRVLHWTPEYKAEAEAVVPYTRADALLQQGRGDEAKPEFERALAQVAQPDRYGLTFLLNYGLAQLHTDRGEFAEAKTRLEAALMSPVRPPEVLPFAYVQLLRGARETHDTVGVERALTAVVAADVAAGGRTGAVEQARALISSQHH